MSLIPVRGAEAQRRVLEAFALDLHTSAPGMIRSYDRDTQTASVIVGVKRVVPSQDDDDPDETEVFPILPAVPVLWPFTSEYFLHLPVKVGDGCLIVFSEADLSAWRAGSGQPVDPGVATRHGLSGAVAILGLSWQARTFSPAADAPEDPAGAELGAVDGVRLMVTRSEVRAGGTHALVRASELSAHLAAIRADLVTVFAAATAGTPTYTAPGFDTANPIASTVTKGA